MSEEEIKFYNFNELIKEKEQLQQRINEIANILTNQQQKIELLEHRLDTANEYIESRKDNMIIDHYNDLKYIVNECDLESSW